MAFLKSPRTLLSLTLCGIPSPWVDKLKLLGNTIVNVTDGCQLDLKVKNSKYIDNNNSICQELYFHHPQCKFKVDSIYNTTTSLGRSCGVLEAGRWISWRPHTTGLLMHNLPWPAHRNLLKPLTDSVHIRRTLIQEVFVLHNKHREVKEEALENLVKYDQI